YISICIPRSVSLQAQHPGLGRFHKDESHLQARIEMRACRVARFAAIFSAISNNPPSGFWDPQSKVSSRRR
ncbi:MAG: hypothetical protein P1V13_24700, partial [Rhizobiaceae bacterium]|nr:hypothetical protein [Rhizobiaceae bacterium]